jgi:hypothetical protein
VRFIKQLSTVTYPSQINLAVMVLPQKYDGMSTRLDCHQNLLKVLLRDACELGERSYRSLHYRLERRGSWELDKHLGHDSEDLGF